MDCSLDLFQQHSLVANEPPILYAQYCAFRSCFLCKPALEFMPNISQTPKIHFLVTDLDMRPSPVQAAMVHMILGEIVGQNLSVKAVDRMKI